MSTPNTEVTATIDGETDGPCSLVFSVAVAEGPGTVREEITCTLDGAAVDLTEIAGGYGTRLHTASVGSGHLEFAYRAVVAGRTGPAPDRCIPVGPAQEILFRRPSRYCESDKLAAIASKEFLELEGQELITAISDWVHESLDYVPGSSSGTDGAVDTLLAQLGVCRDFAHLTVAMLRACQLPARLVSVYAPGLSPMDFHAVAEVALDGRWQVVDATRLAPRETMVRIATGRDAADTAFLTTFGGSFQLGTVEVTAVHGVPLPQEDATRPVCI